MHTQEAEGARAQPLRTGYSIQEVAQDWNCSPRTVRRQIGKPGGLEVFRIGNLLRITGESKRRVEMTAARQGVAA